MGSDDGSSLPRALLTDGEKAALRGEEMADGTRAGHESRIRRKIEQRLAEDVAVLREHAPDYHELLIEVVLEEEHEETTERLDRLERETRELRERVEQLERGE